MIRQASNLARSRRGAVDGGPRGRGLDSPAWGLAALLGAMFLGNVDVAVANVAGPSIRSTLHASGGELELIVSGYTLAYAVLLITCAQLGAARGHRPMFLAGLGGFIVASLACGLAPNSATLIVARIAAGAAAALMTAQVLTGIQLTFSGRARARALGLYALGLSAGAVAGQSLGALLISADVLGTSWRPAFLVNVPIGLVLLCGAWRALPSSDRRPVDLDVRGVAVLSTAIVLLVLPLVLGRDAGWPPWTFISLGLSIVGLVSFVLVERGVAARGGQPLVDPLLLRRPEIGWGLASQAMATATYFAVLFTLALYLQQGLGRSAAYSGLVLVSWVAGFGLPGPVLGRLSARARELAAPAGLIVLSTGFAALWATLDAGEVATAPLVALLGLSGVGLGIAFTGMLSHLTNSVTGQHAAAMSGLFNTTTRLGGVIGTSLFGTIYLALVSHPREAVHGFADVNLLLAATALAAAGLAWVSIRARPATGGKPPAALAAPVPPEEAHN